MSPHYRREIAALCRSGHVDIDTPLASYIGEPAIPMSCHLREALAAERLDILSFSDLDEAPLDMAWSRGGGARSGSRLAIVFGRLGFSEAKRPEGRVTEPPPLRRGKGLLPLHVDAFARSMQAHPERREALLRSGLSMAQADRLDDAVRALLMKKGQAPWALPELRHESAVMTPPRALAGTEQAWMLMAKAPGGEVSVLACVSIDPRVNGRPSRFKMAPQACPLDTTSSTINTGLVTPRKQVHGMSGWSHLCSRR